MRVGFFVIFSGILFFFDDICIFLLKVFVVVFDMFLFVLGIFLRLFFCFLVYFLNIYEVYWLIDFVIDMCVFLEEEKFFYFILNKILMEMCCFDI